jgi:hypothetical protein
MGKQSHITSTYGVIAERMKAYEQNQGPTLDDRYINNTPISLTM